MLERHTTNLGIAVFSIAAIQAGLYSVASHFGQQVAALQYFDPRFGIAALTDLPESGFPNAWEWSAVWALAVVAGLMAARPSRRSLLMYLGVEAILSVPTLFLMGFVLWADLGPTHGLSIAELQWPLAVFVGFSVVPSIVAWRLANQWQLAG